ISVVANAVDGGTPVLDYSATCYPGGFTGRSVGADPNVFITGLANGVPHTCSVTARNSVGRSAASASVAVTPNGSTLPPQASPAGGLTFGGQSLRTTSPALRATITNPNPVTVALTSLSSSNPDFALAHDCATIPP